jgi:hypothetical protein
MTHAQKEKLQLICYLFFLSIYGIGKQSPTEQILVTKR